MKNLKRIATESSCITTPFLLIISIHTMGSLYICNYHVYSYVPILIRSYIHTYVLIMIITPAFVKHPTNMVRFWIPNRLKGIMLE